MYNFYFTKSYKYNVYIKNILEILWTLQYNFKQYIQELFASKMQTKELWWWKECAENGWGYKIVQAKTKRNKKARSKVPKYHLSSKQWSNLLMISNRCLQKFWKQENSTVLLSMCLGWIPHQSWASYTAQKHPKASCPFLYSWA